MHALAMTVAKHLIPMMAPHLEIPQNGMVNLTSI